jgi:lipid II:glycine glycyltransferase (peptidoglycan interpeptide bridge formation enzyme)
MKIIKGINKHIWEKFVILNHGISGSEFLLSPSWFEIVKKEESVCQVLAVVRDINYENVELKVEDVLALVVLIKKPLKRSFFYWYAPRGPLLNHSLKEDEQKKVVRFLISAILRLERKALFLKIEPALRGKKFWQTIFSGGLIANPYRIRRVNPVQPKKTVTLDLNKDLDDLLSEMHQKTRYNIRLSKKKGVLVKEGSDKDFSEFWRLMQETGARDGFRIHDENHYRNLLSNNNSDFIKLYFAEHGGRKIALALVSFFGKKATYLHGASDSKYRNLMAPHLLQWTIIKEAKEKGNKVYDFYGIDEKKWPGVTRFKLGFSKQEKKYAGAYDVVFRPAMYRVYKLLKASLALSLRWRNVK